MSIQAKPLHSVGVPMKRKEDPRFLQGKGQLRRRPVVRHALSLAGAQHLPARRDHEHRHQRGDEGARRQGCDHRQGSRGRRLGWLPTFHGFDKQMVLAIGKVLFQYQEVAAVFAETRAAAVDGAEAVQVDYAPLPVVADPFTSKTDKVLLRPDRESKTNHIFHWESATRKAPLARWRPARSGSSSASGSSGVIPRRSSRAAASPTSTRWAGCSST